WRRGIAKGGDRRTLEPRAEGVRRPRAGLGGRPQGRLRAGRGPGLSEDKIAEKLAAKFGIIHSGSTIHAYMGRRRQPQRAGQTWGTFVRNPARELWACAFLGQYPATFAVAYVFVIMEIASRRIVHANVTTTPTLAWVQQQVREATPAGTTPRF